MRMFRWIAALTLLSQPLAAQTMPGDSSRLAPPLRERPAVDRGAAATGVMGAVALGLLSAWLSLGMCDAADCSGAWREGVGPATVFGGFFGGVLGAAGGLFRTTTRPPLDAGQSRHPRFRISWGAGFVSTQGEQRTLPGLAAAFEIPLLGPLGVEAGGEYFLGAGGWRGAGTAVSLVVNAGWDDVRVRWLGGLGAFTWRNPGYVELNDPRFPGALVEGRIRDSYVRPVYGFGVAVDPAPGWRLHAEVRVHHRSERDVVSYAGFVLGRSWSPFTVGLSRRL